LRKLFHIFLSACLILTATVAFCFITGCTDDELPVDLTGDWTGRIFNPSTKSAWEFHLYMEHNGNDIFGIFYDYRGSITMRNISFDGTDLGFIIDIYPEVVSFFGSCETSTYIVGSWSYSGDGNNGSWYVQNDKNHFNPDEDEEGSDENNNGSSNPFSR